MGFQAFSIGTGKAFPALSSTLNLKARMFPAPETLLFKRSHFETHLPVRYWYSLSHFWAEKREGLRLRMGFTKFATRMVGEIIDYNFETPTQGPVKPGQVLGWVEGFKAISDIICVAEGIFIGANPALERDTELISRAPYAEGWLYEMDGRLDHQSLDVQGYADYLRVTIDMQLQKERADDKRTHGSESDTL